MNVEAGTGIVVATAIIVLVALSFSTLLGSSWALDKKPRATRDTINGVKLLMRPLGLIVIARESPAEYVTKSPHVASLYYTNDLQKGKRAKLRNWIVINERQMRPDKIYAFMPFTLFDVGLKYHATMYVGAGNRTLDVKRLQHVAEEHRNTNIIIFGKLVAPEGVFLRVQDPSVRRAVYDFVHIGKTLPSELTAYLDPSDVFT